MATIQLNAASPSGGMAGVDASHGRLGTRLFRACKGTAKRAARSVNRLVSQVVHPRSHGAPKVGEARPPRASVAAMQAAALGSTQPREPLNAAYAAPARRPNVAWPASQDGASTGIRLRVPAQGRNGAAAASGPLSGETAPDGRPPLPRRPSHLDRLAAGELKSPTASPVRSPVDGVFPAGVDTPAHPPAFAPAAASAPTRALPPTPKPRTSIRPVPKPRSRSAEGARPAAGNDGRPAPPVRSRSADGKAPAPPPHAAPPATRAGAQAAPPVPAAVFHRANTSGPAITTAIGTAPPPLPPRPAWRDGPSGAAPAAASPSPAHADPVYATLSKAAPPKPPRTYAEEPIYAEIRRHPKAPATANPADPVVRFRGAEAHHAPAGRAQATAPATPPVLPPPPSRPAPLPPKHAAGDLSPGTAAALKPGQGG